MRSQLQTARIGIRVPAELEADLRVIASRRRLALSEVVREALTAVVAREAVRGGTARVRPVPIDAKYQGLRR